MTRIAVRQFSARNAEMLAQQGLHPVLARLMAARGLSAISELSNEFNALIAPVQLTHVQQAARFIADAIAQQKKFTVVADYDCDGATACAVAVRGLRAMGATRSEEHTSELQSP